MQSVRASEQENKELESGKHDDDLQNVPGEKWDVLFNKTVTQKVRRKGNIRTMGGRKSCTPPLSVFAIIL